GQPPSQSAGTHPRPAGRAERRRVEPGGTGRAGRQLDADAPRLRIFRQQRQQQAAGAGAEIEEAIGRAAIGEARQHRLDEDLAFRPRLERVGRQGEVETPELALARYPAERLARRDAVADRRDSRLLGGAEHAFGTGEGAASPCPSAASPSLAARSAAESASITSSSASPAMILSIL